MNKKGFVLMETIIVIVIVTVTLVSIFSSYNRILSKLKTENKYDTSEYIYRTYYIKKILQSTSATVDDLSHNLSSSTLKEYSASLGEVKGLFKVKKIYLLTGFNGTGETYKDNLKLFDANMIDYLKKLDVLNNARLIIVEYQKEAKDNRGNNLKHNGKQLYETYISSLEW